MKVEFERTIRDRPVTIYADCFSQDPTVGIGLGPDELWAETEDGKSFELTDDEYSELCRAATEIFIDQQEPPDY